MSLVRLLSAGKSLVGLKESNGRYQLPNHRLLPRFEGRKNPFRNSGCPIQASAIDQEQVAAAPQAKSVLVVAAAVKPAECLKAARTNRAEFVKTVLSRLGGLLKRRAPGKIERSSPRVAKGMVQAELSLDGVKVVRNDLSDTDLEIVPVRPPSPPVQEVKTDPSPAPHAGAVLPTAAAPGAAEVGEKAGKAKVAAAAALVGRLFGAG